MTVEKLVNVLRQIRSAVEDNDPDVYNPRETLRDIHRIADEAIAAEMETRRNATEHK